MILPQVLLVVGHLDHERYVEDILQPPLIERSSDRVSDCLRSRLVCAPYILCELERNQVAKVQRATARASTSVQVEALASLDTIKHKLQITA